MHAQTEGWAQQSQQRKSYDDEMGNFLSSTHTVNTLKFSQSYLSTIYRIRSYFRYLFVFSKIEKKGKERRGTER